MVVVGGENVYPIEVESVPSGGSTFAVMFPRVDRLPSADEPVPSGSFVIASGARKNRVCNTTLGSALAHKSGCRQLLRSPSPISTAPIPGTCFSMFGRFAIPAVSSI